MIGPGIYHDVRFGEYLTWPYPSQSVLKHCRKSPAHYKAALEGSAEFKVTDDMTLGSALHTAFLEPELMPDTVVVWHGAARRGKEWEAFAAEHEGKYILTTPAYERLQGMVRALRRHPAVRQWISQIEYTEVCAVGTIHGLMMKSRCDALTAEPLVDLKKVRTCDLRLFTQQVVNFGYHIQGHIYQRQFNRDRVVLVAVEDSPPHDVVAYELSPAFLRAGEREANELIERVLECSATGRWPGRSAEIVQLEVPDWALAGAGEPEGITIGGVSAFDDGDDTGPF
jgi:hypothetical protein